MKKLKQYIAYAGVFLAGDMLFIGAGMATADVTLPVLWKLNGTGLMPANSSWTLAASSTPFANAHFSQLSVGFIIATSTTASSTFANGITLTGGCFKVGGSCLSSGSTYTGTYPIIVTGTVISSGLATTSSNTWGGTQTIGQLAFTNATGTSIFTSASSTLAIFNSTQLTMSTNGNITIPYAAAPTVATNGDIGIDSTSNQFKYQSGAATKVLGNGNIYPSFTYSTSTAWTGTTTIPLGTAFIAETWNGVQCFTDAGTLQVSFYNTGSSRMNFLNASTTIGTVLLTSNNTFTAGQARYVDVGTPVTAPTKISCTVSKSITAD